MPDTLWDALAVTLLTPIAYVFTTSFPLTSAFIFANILVKN